MTRSESRELAFVLMFEKTFTEDSLEEIIEKSAESREIEVDSFAWEIAAGTLRNLAVIDEVISSYSKNWKITRISRVALSALRIAVYEMLFEDSIPESVSINEAIELAKKFAGSEDAAYVNGVLGAVSRCHKPSNELEKKKENVEVEI